MSIRLLFDRYLIADTFKHSELFTGTKDECLSYLNELSDRDEGVLLIEEYSFIPSGAVKGEEHHDE